MTVPERGDRRAEPGVEQFESLVYEVRRLFHELGSLAASLHGEVTAGQRAVLVDLATSGPQTVPELARKRPVSRQHIQSLVNPLVANGFVEMRRNPAHKRSRRVALTPRGAALVRTIRRREQKWLAEAGIGAEDGELERTARRLRALRDRLRRSLDPKA